MLSKKGVLTFILHLDLRVAMLVPPDMLLSFWRLSCLLVCLFCWDTLKWGCCYMMHMLKEQLLKFYHYSTRSTTASIVLVLAHSTLPSTLSTPIIAIIALKISQTWECRAVVQGASNKLSHQHAVSPPATWKQGPLYSFKGIISCLSVLICTMGTILLLWELSELCPSSAPTSSYRDWKSYLSVRKGKREGKRKPLEVVQRFGFLLHWLLFLNTSTRAQRWHSPWPATPPNLYYKVWTVIKPLSTSCTAMLLIINQACVKN